MALIWGSLFPVSFACSSKNQGLDVSRTCSAVAAVHGSEAGALFGEGVPSASPLDVGV